MRRRGAVCIVREGSPAHFIARSLAAMDAHRDEEAVASPSSPPWPTLPAPDKHSALVRTGRLEKKERRKKMIWGPYVSKWRVERQQGHFEPYKIIEVCECTQEYQIGIKWHISSK